MQVTLIARTEFHTLPQSAVDAGYQWHHYDNYVPSESDADELAEFAGRACYESWTRPNPKTATSEGYLSHILDVGHYSVLAHASVSFYIEDVSRALTLELVRSRFLAFSQKSQRYVKEDNAEMVMPPALRAMQGLAGEFARERFIEATDQAVVAYQALAKSLKDSGLTHKEAREAARSVLPNATATSLVVSGNHRAFRDFIQQRWSVHADAEIRELAGELLVQLREVAPNTYQDIPKEPYGNE